MTTQIPPVTLLAFVEFTNLQLCATACFLEATLVEYEAFLSSSNPNVKKPRIRFPGPGHVDYPKALSVFINFAQDRAQTISANIPMTAHDGAMERIQMTLGDGIPRMFASLLGQAQQWEAFQECAHRTFVLQSRGHAVCVGRFSPQVFLAIVRMSTHGPVLTLANNSRPHPSHTVPRASPSLPTLSTVPLSNRQPNPTCANGHFVPIFTDTWAPSNPARQECFSCFDAIVERCVNGPARTPQYDDAWWDLFELLEPCPKRQAALRALRCFPWMCREWVEIERAAASMMGAADPHCPILAANVAGFTNRRMLAIGTKDIDVVLDRLREDVLRGMEEGRELGRMAVDGVFDWVEKHGSLQFIESRTDFEWYHVQYRALADLCEDILEAIEPSPRPSVHFAPCIYSSKNGACLSRDPSETHVACHGVGGIVEGELQGKHGLHMAVSGLEDGDWEAGPSEFGM